MNANTLDRPVCPCCRQSLPPNAIAPKDLHRYFGTTPLLRSILEVLGRRPGQWISPAAIADAAYAHRADGGPEWALNSIAVTIHRYRKRTVAYGWKIEGRKWAGYRLVAEP